MPTCLPRNRLTLKRGTDAVFQITVDTTQLPSGSLAGYSALWNVKRTLTQPWYTLQLGSGAVQIIDSGAGTGLGIIIVTTTSVQTAVLQSGDYYWELQFQNILQVVNARVPPESYGELIILDSL